MQIGDRMNTHFFYSVWEWLPGGLITTLFDEDNIFVSSRTNVDRICKFLNSKLQARPVLDEQQKEYKVELLSYVPSKISLIAQKIMEAPFAEK